MSAEKQRLLTELSILLDVDGVESSWEMLEAELDRLPMRAIRALLYRVGRARAQAFEEGVVKQRRGIL